MQTIEYRGHDKSTLPPGPWMAEPDKKQWQDLATGLPCLIVRNRMGALCGYVGVPEGHPLWGKDYGECSLKEAKPRGHKPEDDVRLVPNFPELTVLPELPKSWRERREAKLVCGAEDYCDHRPECLLSVHGGITFSNFCQSHDRQQWEEWRARMRSAKFLETAAKYPEGDHARALAEAKKDGTLDSYEAWVADHQCTGICHKPDAGEPDNVWWFGFDCAHSGDLVPEMRNFHRKHMSDLPEPDWEVYRDFEYVTAECRGLAKQLIELQPRKAGRAFDLESESA